MSADRIKQVLALYAHRDADGKSLSYGEIARRLEIPEGRNIVAGIIKRHGKADRCLPDSARKSAGGQPGDTFGPFTLIRFEGYRGSNRKWLCRCECGEERLITYGYLKSGASAKRCMHRTKRIAS